MDHENVLTHLIISVLASIPAILAGIVSILVALRQLKQAQQTHTTVNGRVDQLVSAREDQARLEERLRNMEEKATGGVYNSVNPFTKELK
jgi:hypothetical protein